MLCIYQCYGRKVLKAVNKSSYPITIQNKGWMCPAFNTYDDKSLKNNETVNGLMLHF